MNNNVNLYKNDDGTFDLLIIYSTRTDVEFSFDFLSSKNIKNDIDNFLSYIKKNAEKIKINAVKVLVGGTIIATMPFNSFMNIYGAESKYSMAYLYASTVSQQITDIESTNGAINTISPNYFSIASDGSLQINSISGDLISYAHNKGIKIIPFLSNHWDRQAGINALNNADAIATQIASYISSYNLDGINVDIENVTETERTAYTNFVSILRSKLPVSKEISVAVAANPNSWTNGWQGSYDYAGLANSSNYIMVMAYDEHWQGSSSGPVASISFVENSIKYSLSKTSGDKIVLGLPMYGRMWDNNGNFNGNGVTLDKVAKFTYDYTATVTYDDTFKCPKAVFTVTSSSPLNTVNGKTLTPGIYTIWYENEASIQAKIALVNQYGLKGVSVWAIGMEPSTIWQNYSSWLNNTSVSNVNTTPQPTTLAAPTVIKTGVVSASLLNVRSGPSTNYQIVSTLRKGASVNITGSTNGWYSILLSNGQTAYVSSSYISDTPTVSAVSATQVGTVTTSLLNVRSSPSTRARIVSTLRRGSSVNIIGSSNGWYTIRLSNGQTAYVSSSYVSTRATANTATTSTARTGTVTVNGLNVRSSPSTRARILTSLRRGTSVSILSTSGGWHKIRLSNGTIAYVSASYVR